MIGIRRLISGSRNGTRVTICAALILFAAATGATAVFGPPSGLIEDEQTQSLDMARAHCEISLQRSILKRTDATEDEARASAASRCGLLFESVAAPRLIRVDQSDG